MRLWTNPDNPKEQSQVGVPLEGMLRKYVPADEHVVLWLHPSPWFIFIRSIWVVAFVVLLVVGVRYAASILDLAQIIVWAAWLGVAVLIATVVWQTFEWLSRLYVLTDKRMIAVAGILRQSVGDVPLRNVRNLVIVRSLFDRLMGLGTLGAATAGTMGYEMVWVELDRPTEVMRAVRQAVDQAAAKHRPTDEKPSLMSPNTALPPDGPIVIGMTGGIGAGKSSVAQALAERGFLMIDSDKVAKEALDRLEIRAQLVEWWGDRILTPQGTVDRKVVGNIVFTDPTERARLEALVHPLVKAGRAELIGRAHRENRPGVVVDAPLLFEAGSDAECDAVIYVDAPREQRLERVLRTRAWDQAELDRREKAQLPLEEKRRRSDVVVLNDSTPDVLKARVDEALQILQARRRQS